MDGGDSSGKGAMTCVTWIRRPKNTHLVVLGKSSPSSLDIFSFDPKTTSLSSYPKVKFEFEEGVNPVTIAVHPSGDDVVCSTSTGGCKEPEKTNEELWKMLAGVEMKVVQSKEGRLAQVEMKVVQSKEGRLAEVEMKVVHQNFSNSIMIFSSEEYRHENSSRKSRWRRKQRS